MASYARTLRRKQERNLPDPSRVKEQMVYAMLEKGEYRCPHCGDEATQLVGESKVRDIILEHKSGCPVLRPMPAPRIEAQRQVSDPDPFNFWEWDGATWRDPLADRWRLQETR